ncbi:hypothetical protein F5884DRAFT_204035 [Xylogone sp. PMI_703]|nr:hypothetical protein F5884DRAFT_204035 [Xylogone sp. PMI_703]
MFILLLFIAIKSHPFGRLRHTTLLFCFHFALPSFHEAFFSRFHKKYAFFYKPVETGLKGVLTSQLCLALRHLL